jgi:hypothetical protein
VREREVQLQEVISAFGIHSERITERNAIAAAGIFGLSEIREPIRSHIPYVFLEGAARLLASPFCRPASQKVSDRTLPRKGR